jgi:DNA/RNA endonuclease YhcR with UshA esterase domain
MKLSSLILGAFVAIAVIAGVLWVLGVSFHPPVSAQGSALYNPAEEITIKGVVQEVQEFDCPVSEGELASHLMLKTPDGTLQVHLAPTRIISGQKLNFAPGDQLQVVGAKFRFEGKKGVIARVITRGNETITLRDQAGNLLLTQ